MAYYKKLLHDALNEYFAQYAPDYKWDGTHIEIISSPKYIDDDACLEVCLENANGLSQYVKLAIGGLYE